MRVRRRVAVLVVLSGLVAAGIGFGTAEDTPATAATARPILGQQLDEFRPPPAAEPHEAPSLAELALPADNLSPQAMARLKRTIGKLYVTFPDQTWYWGTATVVTSQSQDMLLTAAHLFVKRGSHLRAEAVRFVPGEEYGDPPHGVWIARDWRIPDTYTADSPDWAQDDVAVVLLHTSDGRHIQEAVGSQGICFDCPRQALVHVYGYPSGYEGGAALYTGCRVVADFRNVERPGDLFGLCREGTAVLTPGSSGAGLLTDLDPATGLGRIMAINTWGPPDVDLSKPANRGFDPNTPPNNGGSYLSDIAKDLYNKYQGA